MVTAEERRYRIGDCVVVVLDRWQTVRTEFPDGSEAVAQAETTDAAIDRAVDMGYDSTWDMTRDHELAHTWLAVQQGERFSTTLWLVAHDSDLDQNVVRAEEARVLRQQKALGAAGPWEGCRIDT